MIMSGGDVAADEGGVVAAPTVRVGGACCFHNRETSGA